LKFNSYRCTKVGGGKNGREENKKGKPARFGSLKGDEVEVDPPGEGEAPAPAPAPEPEPAPTPDADAGIDGDAAAPAPSPAAADEATPPAAADEGGSAATDASKDDKASKASKSKSAFGSFFSTKVSEAESALGLDSDPAAGVPAPAPAPSEEPAEAAHDDDATENSGGDGSDEAKHQLPKWKKAGKDKVVENESEILAVPDDAEKKKADAHAEAMGTAGAGEVGLHKLNLVVSIA
jgi:hypothetical protein